MMHYLFSYKGRISRRGMWLGYVVNLVYMVALVGLIGLASSLLGGPGPLDAIWFAFASKPTAAWMWATLAIYWGGLGAFLYPLGAIATKRLHDRNKSGRWLAGLAGIPFGVVAITAAAFACQFIPDGAKPVLFGIGAISELLLIWLFVELFFLPGTKGANRFGPDPRV